jgi:hypothetical protein
MQKIIALVFQETFGREWPNRPKTLIVTFTPEYGFNFAGRSSF